MRRAIFLFFENRRVDWDQAGVLSGLNEVDIRLPNPPCVSSEDAEQFGRTSGISYVSSLTKPKENAVSVGNYCSRTLQVDTDCLLPCQNG